MGERAEALAAYEEGLAIRRKLLDADPNNAARQADVAFNLAKVAAASELPRARAALREAVAIMEKLETEGRLTTAQRGWPKWFREQLAKLPAEEAEAR
jgi:hypothetical protein